MPPQAGPRAADRRIYDISQPLTPATPMWPGDTPFSQQRTWSMAAGGVVNVSAVSFSTHAGTHADAPLHYVHDGAPVGGADLQVYIGPCRVIDLRGAGPLVQAHHICGHLQDAPARLLVRTYDAFPHTAWDADFTAVAPEAIDAAAAAGVRLLGVDAPSLDPAHSKTMDAHAAVARHAMAILEGLVLDAVPPGDYELIALPLPFAMLDAAPVRAVLRALS